MSMAVAYSNFCGLLVHENRGGTKSAFVADTLGSTTVVLDNTGTEIYGAQYWPYGETRSESGSNPSPWSFVGLRGYFADVISDIIYVRKRYLKVMTSQWLTTDSLWPDVAGYTCCESSPLDHFDPSGDSPAPIKSKLPKALTGCLSARAQSILMTMMANTACAAAIKAECKESGLSALNDSSIVPSWEFPIRCSSDPRVDSSCHRKVLGRFPPGQPIPKGTQCVPTGICINSGTCTGTGPRPKGGTADQYAACIVLWELGNACGCKTWGYDPGSEAATQRINAACGCGWMAGGHP